jgi:hypothetical protein
MNKRAEVFFIWQNQKEKVAVKCHASAIVMPTCAVVLALVASQTSAVCHIAKNAFARQGPAHNRLH